MKILVTGGGGQLGLALAQQSGHEISALERRQLDIGHPSDIAAVLEEAGPEAVINCAAYTQVDRAEEEPALCEAINVEGVGHLATACAERGIRLVHVSTDYVFGQVPRAPRPWSEHDDPQPRGVYASSKRRGEVIALARCADTCVVRTCGLYDRASETRTKNFVKSMLRLAGEREVVQVVDDQTCTPTFVEDLAPALLHLAAHEITGVVHVTAEGATTWCDFARAIFAIAALPVRVEPITSEQFGALAPRPAYSVLSSELYSSLGSPPMRHWSSALRDAVTT